MKKVNATFEVESDLSEYKLRQMLDSMGAKYIKTLPCTDHLKEDSQYKELMRQKKLSEKRRYEYIKSKK